MKKIIFGVMFIILACLVLFYVLPQFRPDYCSEQARCVAEDLKETGAIYYISLGCPACARQKAIFGEYFSIIPSVDCREEPEKCIEAGVSHVPTLILNGESYTGVNSLDDLEEILY